MKIIIVQSHQQSKSLGLEATERKTQPYLATCNLGGFEATEYWPLVCMEEGNQSGDLAISGGHGNAQEEYAMRRQFAPHLRMFIAEIK